MERCKTCRYWREGRAWNRDGELTTPGFGACDRIRGNTTVEYRNAATGALETRLGLYNMRELTPGRTEAVVMQEGPLNDVVTGADFGCTLHEPLSDPAAERRSE